MHYSTEVTVSLTRKAVLRLLADRSNDMRWRPDLTLCEPLGGDPGRPGAETRLLYRIEGGRVREKMERVNSDRLPDAIEYSLRSPDVVEHQLHRFVDGVGAETRWIIHSTVEFRHARIMRRHQLALLERDTRQSMESFKGFAEGLSGRPRLSADGRVDF